MTGLASNAEEPVHARSDVATDVDYERDGKQVSVLRVPHSSNTSAYGVIPVPIAVIRNGSDPTVLLMAGNHGDEYEGPLALGDLIRTLALESVTGRLILLPAANYPALMAGSRNSPLDGGNLNRSFPGDVSSGPTARIAHYIESVILPMCDAWIDLHSGGVSLDSIPCVNLLMSDDAALQQKTMAMAVAFGTPLVVAYDDIGGSRTSLATGLRHGIPSINTEMGGGGAISIAGLRICREGVRNVLAHLGVLNSDALPRKRDVSTRFVRIQKTSYVYANDSGVFEPVCDLGEMVTKGQLVGYIHFLADPSREPVTVSLPQSGILCMKRSPARVEPGDCIALVCADTDPVQ